MAVSRKNSIFSTAFSLYNNNLSSLACGFANNAAMFKISPVKPEFAGKQPRRGEVMYDAEKSSSFTLNLYELLYLREWWADICSGNKDISFKHSFGEDTKILRMGYGLYEGAEYEDNFYIAIEHYDRDSRSDEPLDIKLYTFGRDDELFKLPEGHTGGTIGLLAIKEWLQQSIELISGGIYHAVETKLNYYFNRNNTNTSRDDRRSSDYDDDNYSRPTPRRRTSEPRNDDDYRSERSSSRRSTRETTMDDDMPF